MIAASTPKLSVIVIAYRMPGQLENTLLSLAPDYQLGVSEQDYEVIVMENSSGDNLPPEKLAALPDNFHYRLREEASSTPVYAVNEAFALSRAPFICLMIDGARMVSPRVIQTALMAYAMNPDAVVAVPGYQLGSDEQHMLEDVVDQLAYEQQLLASINWREDGYELFAISSLSGANHRGYLQPMMECNCVFASAKNYAAIGYANTDFQYPGGGSVNLHIYRSLGMLPATKFFVTPGEGSFHQYHDGVTTSSYAERAAAIEKHTVQLHSYWPGGFQGLRRDPILLGRVPVQAQPFLIKSLECSKKRFERLLSLGKAFWPDDPV
jgi:glycosyltransferase involved in cell wall biosynthesis